MSKDKNYFHLPLNSLSKDNKLTILGGADSEAIALGNPKIVNDPIIGRCLEFDGKDDYVQFTQLKNFDFSKGITFCGWVRFDELTKDSNIFNFSRFEDLNDRGVWLANGNKQNNLRSKYHQNHREINKDDVIKTGEWQHLAYSYDIKGEATLYLNGKNIKSKKVPEYSIKDDFKMGYLGKSNYSADDLFKGAMAHCRFYTYVLDENAIKGIMLKEQRNAKVFHLPLDEIRYNSDDKTSILPNVGGFGSDAITHGNPKIVYDQDMGTCLEFDGEDDYVELTNLESFNFEQGISFAAWVRFDALNNWSRIYDFATKDNDHEKAICLANIEETDGIVHRIGERKSKQLQTIEVGKWQHFAVTYNSKDTEKLYLNGREIASNKCTEKLGSIKWKLGYLGKSNWKGDGLFEGVMAHVRIYKHAISQEEIKALMQADQNSMAHYRETTLLKVDLYTIYDDNHKPVLFIESKNKSEPLEVSLTNPSNKPVTFKAFEEATEENFQVQLRFRRNVIEPTIFEALKKGDIKVEGWTYTIGTTRNKREDYISFVRNDGAFTLNSGDVQLIQLPKFSAAAKGGSRNTRIEVRFRTDVQDPGSVIRHMEIHSHLGLKTIPLVARIKGANTVLNDGREPNEKTIKIEYTKTKGSVKLNKLSRFTLLFDEELFGKSSVDSEDKTVKRKVRDENGIIQEKTVKIKELKKEKKKGDKREKAKEGETPASKVVNADTKFPGLNTQPRHDGIELVSFAFDAQDDNIEIKEGQAIEINITNFVTNATNGTHNLLLRYEDIEGYWDGAWIIPLEFSPLVIQDNKVGIGTDDPQAKLQVRNGAIMPMEGQGENTGIRFLPNAYGGGGDRAYMEYYARVEGDEGTTLKIANENDDDDHIALMPSGNVGVGTDAPADKLHIISESETLARFTGKKDSSIIIESEDSNEAYIRFQNKTTKENGNKAWMLGMDDDEHFYLAFSEDGEIDLSKSYLKIGKDGNMSIATRNKSTVSLGFRSDNGKPDETSEENFSAGRITAGWEDGIYKYANSFIKLENADGENSYKTGLTLKNGNVGVGTTDPKIQLALGDSDTGFEQKGDGELAIITNNKERIRITDDGKVGIGKKPSSTSKSILQVDGQFRLDSGKPVYGSSAGVHAWFKKGTITKVALREGNYERKKWWGYANGDTGVSSNQYHLFITGFETHGKIDIYESGDTQFDLYPYEENGKWIVKCHFPFHSLGSDSKVSIHWLAINKNLF